MFLSCCPGDPISVDLNRQNEWDEAIRLHFYNHENELMLHGRSIPLSLSLTSHTHTLLLVVSLITRRYMHAHIHTQTYIWTLPHTLDTWLFMHPHTCTYAHMLTVFEGDAPKPGQLCEGEDSKYIPSSCTLAPPTPVKCIPYGWLIFPISPMLGQHCIVRTVIRQQQIAKEHHIFASFSRHRKERSSPLPMVIWQYQISKSTASWIPVLLLI